MILDLGELEFCDSSGLRLLIRLDRAASDRGIEVVVRRPHPIVRRVLEVMAVDCLLTIADADFRIQAGSNERSG